MDGVKKIPTETVDLVITDPPYGIDFQSQWRKDKMQWKPKILNDERPFTDFIYGLKRIVKKSGAVMIFTRWDVQQTFIDVMTEEGMKPKNILIWDKVIHGMGDLQKAYGSRYESIIFWANKNFRFNGKRPIDIIRWPRVNPADLLHPNEKPVGLIKELIRQTTHEGDVVADLFMGSGTTAIACIETDRNYIGFELDKKYVDIARKRIKGHNRQLEFPIWSGAY